jgi:hypothetical protein
MARTVQNVSKERGGKGKRRGDARGKEGQSGMRKGGSETGRCRTPCSGVALKVLLVYFVGFE